MRLPDLGFAPTIGAVIRRITAAHGDNDFIVLPDQHMTFGEAEAASRRVAKLLLAAGVGKGTRIGIMYPYGTEWVVAWLAATRIGALCMPFSTSYKPLELRKSLRIGDVDTLLVPSSLFGQDHEAFIEAAVPGLSMSSEGPLRVTELPFLRRVWVSGGARNQWAHPISLQVDGAEADSISDELFEAVEAEVTPADLLMTIFTSGTTSEPKAVVHTHGSFLRHGANLARFQGISAEDRMFCGMPFFWIGGVGCSINFALATGSALLCVERFEFDAVLDLIQREKATRLWMWPELTQKLHQGIVASGRDVSSIPALAPAHGGRAITDDPEHRHNSMGMTETVGPHSGPGPEGDRVLPEEMRGSFGLLVPFVEHRISDPVTNESLPDGEMGELCIRGYSVMHGFYKKERHEAFDDDGWYHTGDRSYLRNGYLYCFGRFSELIKTSGANVAPREIEVLLEENDEIGQAIVLGIPDAERGEVVGAMLVPRPETVIDIEVVLQRLDEAVSSFKIPRKVLVLESDAVPYLASGKPDKGALRRMIAEC